jgi:serine phosphatase RsbU (regulator of sigma subunit)
MSPESELVEKLTILNHIAGTLNRAVDVHSVLNDALAELVRLMDLETGWISLRKPAGADGSMSNEWALAAHHNLPPALAPDSGDAWVGLCACQELCMAKRLNEAYNEVHCSRLGRAHGDRRGLAVHATTPLRSGDRSLGILNVAAPDWNAFSPQALSLLTNVGSQMGAALERARLYDLVQERRLHQQAALLEFSDRLLRQRDLDELMSYLVAEVIQMLSADSCALLLPGEEPGFLEFRASSGWRIDPGAERRRVPADERTGPGHVMHTRLPMMAEDIMEHDPAPWVPEWLEREGFRGHAVVPLLAEDRSIGVLVVNQRQPRILRDEELSTLQLMANQAAIAIEKARLHSEEVKMQALERELEIGRQIQLSLLPDAPPVVPGWEFAAFYQAAREVGGDFYDFFSLPTQPERQGLVIADVTGKGVPAALFMARAGTMIRSTALTGLSPAAVLGQANDLMLEDRKAELFVTAFYGLLETDSGRLVYANAGHSRPLLLPAGKGACQELPTGGILLGAFQGIELEEGQVDVAPGDLLVFYTDGVSEAMDTQRRFFGEERLRAVIAANAGASAQEVLEAVVDAVSAFSNGAAQSDDLTLCVIRRCPKP